MRPLPTKIYAIVTSDEHNQVSNPNTYFPFKHPGGEQWYDSQDSARRALRMYDKGHRMKMEVIEIDLVNPRVVARAEADGRVLSEKNATPIEENP